MKAIIIKDFDGKEHKLKVGDWVGFKSDIEQGGQIVTIFPNGMLELHNPNGFIGEYIGGDEYTDAYSGDCWV